MATRKKLRKLSPKTLVKRFETNPDSFERWLKKQGFVFIGSGAFSMVFSHKKVNYVVKIGAGEYEIPRGKYYLKPLHVVNDGDGMMIQPKCESVYNGDQEDDWDEDTDEYQYWRGIVEKLASKCVSWCDDHCGNVGIYKGQPVIIDW